MPWIETIDEKSAEGDLKDIYAEARAKRGKVANILKVQSLNPRALKAHLDLYIALMFGTSGLSREEREILACAVSAANSCNYCVSHHSHALDFYWRDPERVRAVCRDVNCARLSPRASAMVAYAKKLTERPRDINASDTEALRRAGFSDADILDICLIAAYFNFVNRIALGLGVSESPEEVKGYLY